MKLRFTSRGAGRFQLDQVVDEQSLPYGYKADVVSPLGYQAEATPTGPLLRYFIPGARIVRAEDPVQPVRPRPRFNVIKGDLL
jgi:hypothetical protein